MQISRPVDAHVHLRVGEMLEAVVPLVVPHCQAAVVMPNTANIRTGAQAARHRDEIIAVAARAGYPDFRPLMTILLTDDTNPADVATWPDANVVAGKYYPADLYPHGGVSNLAKVSDVLDEMKQAGIPVSGHFERAGGHPLFAEQAAIPDFRWIADGNRVIFEHVSTVAGLEAVRQYPHARATITPQHLWMTAHDVYDSNLETVRYPHNWCRPVAKTAEDRQALIESVVSNNPQFLFGSDFAPHLAFSKVNIPPPAGCACYPAALSVLAQVFNEQGRLSMLDRFTSEFASNFYGTGFPRIDLPLMITEEEWRVPSHIPVGSQGEMIIPWLAGEILSFSVVPSVS